MALIDKLTNTFKMLYIIFYQAYGLHNQLASYKINRHNYCVRDISNPSQVAV